MWKHRVKSDKYFIEITGGSVKIMDRCTNNQIKVFKEYTYLYTGDIRPDESEFFALENGKHFYVYSLKSFEMIKRVTLPKTYESIDVNGFYSDNGSILNIPVQRYVYDNKEEHKGHYEHILCQYETDNYTLIGKTNIEDHKKYRWKYIVKDDIYYSCALNKEIIF